MLKLLDKPKLLKYLVAAVLLAVPLYPKFPFVRIAGTYVAIRLEDFLMLTLGIIGIVFWLPRIKELLRDSLLRKIAIFLATGLVATVSGIILTRTVIPHIGILHWLRRIEYLIPLFVGLIVFRKDDRGYLEFFVKILMLVIFIVFLYGAGQKYFGWPVIITQNLEYSKGIALRWVPGAHINSTFAGHYDLATFLVMTLPIFVVFLFTLSGKITKFSILIVIITGLWLLANAISRVSVVSYMIGATLSLIFVKKYKEVFFVLFVSLIFFSFSGDLISRYERVFDVTKMRIQRLLYLSDFNVFAQAETFPQKRIREASSPTPNPIFEDRSTSIRLNVEWPRALRAFEKDPLLGTGYSSITLASDSEYLRALGETGLLGFVAFSLILLEIGFLFYKRLPLASEKFSTLEQGFLAGIFGSLPGILVNALFIDVFEASKFAITFWLLIGIALSLIKNRLYEQNN